VAPNIKHLVVVMMENHSFDQYFGTFPGAAGFLEDSPAFSQPYGSLGTLKPWRRSTFTTPGSIPEGMNHAWPEFQVALGGAVSEQGGVYTRAGDNMGFFDANSWDTEGGGVDYYTANDVPYHWALARNFALCDNYHQSAIAGTYPNRMYLTSGTILGPSVAGLSVVPYDAANDKPVIYNGPTGKPGPTSAIGGANTPGVDAAYVDCPNYLQALHENNRSYAVYDDWNWTFDWSPFAPIGNERSNEAVDLNIAGYYPPYNGIPLGQLGDPSYYAANYTDSGVSAPNDLRPLFAQHIAPRDPAVAAQLAAVTWICPPWHYSEHPGSNSKTMAADGARYLSQIVDAVIESEFWESTALVVVYDESDCHFDHVVPPTASSADEPWVNDAGGYGQPAPIGAGPRVPAIVVSPWTYRRGVIHTPMDHTSLLQLTEDVTGQPCEGLPNPGWRRSTFANLGAAIAELNSTVTPASSLERNATTGIPTAATAQEWQRVALERHTFASDPANAGSPEAQPTRVPRAQTWPPVLQECEIVLVQASFGRGQVESKAQGEDTATFTSAIAVTVSGFEPSEITTPRALFAPSLPGALTAQPGVSTRIPSISFTEGGQPVSGIDAVPTSVSPDPDAVRAEAGVPEMFTFFYDVVFTDMSTLPVFDFPANTQRTLQVQATFSVDTTVTSSAPLELVESGNPQFYHAFYDNQPWLSGELRVVQFKASDTAFGLPQHIGDAPSTFAEALLASLNQQANAGAAETWFDELAESETQSWLSLLETDGHGDAVYNFAFARVHMEGLEQAEEVRVFFRLFPTLSTSTDYSSYYNSIVTTDPSSQPGLISVPGIGVGGQAGEYVTLPFYAAQRVPFSEPLSAQSDPANVLNIPTDGVTPAAGATYAAYYGCWLDINRSAEQYIPKDGVPANAADALGPFPDNSPADPQSPLAWIRGLHQCVVAEISYKGITIPFLASTGTSPWLAQRNVLWVPSSGGG
jgi:phospholipase C